MKIYFSTNGIAEKGRVSQTALAIRVATGQIVPDAIVKGPTRDQFLFEESRLSEIAEAARQPIAKSCHEDLFLDALPHYTAEIDAKKAELAALNEQIRERDQAIAAAKAALPAPTEGGAK